MCWQELRPLSVPNDFKLGQTDHKGHRDLWSYKVGHGDF